MKHLRSCELCKAQASLYCEADSAFLCWACDTAVHGANFLVARHRRTLACAECGGLDSSVGISGAGSQPFRSICRSCDPDGPIPSSPSSSPSSSCISSAESAAAPEAAKKGGGRRSDRRRRRGEVFARVEGVLARWSRAMGLHNGITCAAAHELGACPGVMAVLPFRVCLAAALWYGIKLAEGRGGRTCGELLTRLEACSGVPSKLILVAESRLSRLAGGRREGWAEC